MINHDVNIKTIKMTNNALKAVLDYSSGTVIKEFTNIYSGKKINTDKELFLLKIYEKEYKSSDFELADIITAVDETEELITVLFELKEEIIKVKVHFINDKKETIRILYQVYDGYKYGVPYVSMLRIPLLAEMRASDGEDLVYCPGNPVKTPEGKEIIMPMREAFYDSDIKLPLIVCDKDNKYGYSIQFPNISDLNDGGATQNIGKLLSRMSSKEEFENHYLRINPDASFNDTLELTVTGIKEGWVEAFDRYRDYWAAEYDFSEYDREDLKWWKDCAVHNFTFLYGKQAFDHDNQVIDTERLLKEGEEFGGYDSVILWNLYPRLGIDKRTQWDFYDDFPGGREALRKAVDEFHENGVYVFLPYIPWDRGRNESTDSMGEEFVRIVKDTNADGYHLDTMVNLPYSYRKGLDELRPGLVLMTQHHPGKKHSMEFLTASWDEFWRFAPMPEVDVLRFMCPQHVSPVISRWLRKEDRDILIRRSQFGGAPIVIWQDIFGRWMPFEKSQKEEIKKWKNIYLKYKEIFHGLKPIPLYPTNTLSLYCNIFQSGKNKEKIYAFYNDSDELTEADVKLYQGDCASAEIILGDGDCKFNRDSINIKIKPKEVLQILTR
jgi:hypothetical protein